MANITPGCTRIDTQIPNVLYRRFRMLCAKLHASQRELLAAAIREFVTRQEAELSYKVHSPRRMLADLDFVEPEAEPEAQSVMPAAGTV